MGERVAIFSICANAISDELLDQYETWLSDVERVCLNGYRVDSARREYLAGKALTRAVLSGYLDCAPAEVRFAHSSNGKPHLMGSRELHFNLSHVGGFAVLAVTRAGPIGVDVECVGASQIDLAIARRFFDPAEYRDVLRVEPDCQKQALLYLWTLKESYLKATGEGLTVSLADIHFAVSEGNIQLHRVGGTKVRFGMCFQLFRLLEDYICAVALCAARVKCFAASWYHAFPGQAYRPYCAMPLAQGCMSGNGWR